MTRLVGADFDLVRQYVEHYRAATLVDGSNRELELKRMHKKLLGSLQLWAEIQRQSSRGEFYISEVHVPPRSAPYDQIAESFSDLTTTFGTALHGLLKPASMTLRSCIETFIRGCCGVEDQLALDERNVYRLFERAENSPFFSGHSKQYLTALHRIYKELCLVAHSSPRYLARIGSLEDITRSSIADLRRLASQGSTVATASAGALVAASPTLFLAAKPKARDLLEVVVPTAARLRALGAS